MATPMVTHNVLDGNIVDKVITVTDDDAMRTTRMLAKTQGLMCGTSSGANIWAAMKAARKFGNDKMIATVLPDRMGQSLSRIICYERLISSISSHHTASGRPPR